MAYDPTNPPPPTYRPRPFPYAVTGTKRPADVLVEEAAYYYFTGNFDAALALASDALKTDPGNRRAFAAKVLALCELARPTEALNTARAFLSLAPRDAIASSVFAVALARNGDHHQAQNYFARSLALDPKNHHVYYNFAAYCAETGDRSKCRRYLEFAEALSPGSFQAAARDFSFTRVSSDKWFQRLLKRFPYP